MFDQLIYRSEISLVMKILLTALVSALCSGCLDVAQPASAAPVVKLMTPEEVDATIKLLDDATYRPELHDDFKKPEGVTPRAEAPKEVASKILVLVYGPKACIPCRKCVEEGNTSKRFHFEKRDVIPKNIAAFADKWNQSSYPVVIFIDRNSTERGVAPWRGLTDFERRYDRAVPPRAPPVKAQAGTIAHNSPIYSDAWSSSWSWLGDLRRHLVADHGFSQSQVDAMSDAQAVGTHNAAHEATASAPKRERRRRGRAA